jgi:hypothetical protein
MLPRILAVILLITSIIMLAPIGAAVIAMAGGTAVPIQSWAIPLVILAIGSLLTWMLTRKNIALHLYLAAFALWIVTAGYFVVRYVRLP